MEEKKTKAVRKTARTKKEGQQKLSYEELNNVCAQLFQQNQYLTKKVSELGNTNMFKRLDYLFKVVELASAFKDADFINNCIDEIKEAMAPLPLQDEIADKLDGKQE